MPGLALETLGWSSFQSLCVTITREILGQTVEEFLPTHDGGRDGAFRGRWQPPDTNDILEGAFVVQCKHTSRASANLRLSDVADELTKATALVEQGLCDTYLLLTNASVSALVAAELDTAFRTAGVRHFRAFGRTWIESTIRESPRLRALVPRVYGLGDLSEILDERAYEQARSVLDTMREDLAKFVVTEPYSSAVRALQKHRFVLLLGEPAAGKTMIASALSVAATDLWGARVIKADAPGDIRDHWNPNAADQLFWIDDAFGTIQYQPTLSNAWNHQLYRMKAAVHGGTRFILTSRDYIYADARRHLKQDVLPLLSESQVVIQVQDLPLSDKQQILYNHIRLGRQPRGFRRAIKPFLESVASSARFLPEVARRLGDPSFTKGLTLSYAAVRTFVEEPLDFLLGVIRSLDSAGQAALSLVFLAGGFLESPTTLTGDQRRALELFGVSEAACHEALGALDGSMLTFVTSQHHRGWTVRHPTVLDAVARRVVEDPGLLDIYLTGAGIEELLTEVTIGRMGIEGVSVVVPPNRHALMLQRLDDAFGQNTDWDYMLFLATRCSREFLEAWIPAHQDLLSKMCEYHQSMDTPNPRVLLAERIDNLGLLSETNREVFVRGVRTLAVDSGDIAFLRSDAVRSLMRPDEIDSTRQEVRQRVIPDLEDLVDGWSTVLDEGDDASDYLYPLREMLDAYAEEWSDDAEAMAEIRDARLSVDALEEELRVNQPREPDWDEYDDYYPRADHEPSERSIFDDIDE